MRFLHSNVELLGGLRSGQYLPDRVINLALNYIMTAVPNKRTYEVRISSPRCPSNILLVLYHSLQALQ